MTELQKVLAEALAQPNPPGAAKGEAISLPPPTAITEQRDYLSEAWRIIGGTTMLLAQREHLIALQKYHLEILKVLRDNLK